MHEPLDGEALNMTRHYFALLLAGVAPAAWGQPTTIVVPANRSWTNTGIYLNPGSNVQLEARGAIEAAPPSDKRPMFHRVPPSGRPERQSNKPQPQMPALVMLARIGGGPVLEAGARAQFRAGGRNGTGQLQLGINDDYVADNTGSWTVRVTVTGADPAVSEQRGDGRYQSDQAPPQRSEWSQGPSDIEGKAKQLGIGILGAPQAALRTTSDGSGRYRDYQNGAIYWSPTTGAHAVVGEIQDRWRNEGGLKGDLGYPVSDEMPTRDGTGRMTRFQGGTIVWSDRDGVSVERPRN